LDMEIEFNFAPTDRNNPTDEKHCFFYPLGIVFK